MPVQNTLIEGSVEKMDGSGETMDIAIYNGGNRIWTSSTAKPYGMVDLHIEVGAAVISNPAPTPVPTEIAAAPTPDTSLTLQPVPATGVWVRVAYPGNFTGTIRANGFEREVSGSGVQDYQVSLATGTIEGFIAKEDGSVKDLVVQVYREKTLISVVNTSIPRGSVEFLTLV
jgi:hypothetical protein